MLLNHDYSDMRGCDIVDLVEALRDEAEYRAQAELLERDSAEMVDLLDETYENGDGGVDLGVTAAVVAISAAGGAPISSCNGGWFAEGHASVVPYVLFSISPERLPPILAAADSAGCGLENSGRHAELYVDDL